MATFKAVVQKHQQRRDGKFPVSIRVTNNRKSTYVPTGLYCSLSQINKKTFEIKDQFVIARTVQMMTEMERKLLTIDSVYSASMSPKEMKKFFTLSSRDIDFLEEARAEISSNPLKWRHLAIAMPIFAEMGIESMRITEFSSFFLQKFMEFLDNKRIPVTKNGIIVGYRGYAQNTKHGYVASICHMFRYLQRKYNTEFNQVISHNPFINFKNYAIEQTPKRSMTTDRLRDFFDLPVKIKSERETIDLMKLSFCLCGINLIDIFSLEKSAFDRNSMRITFNRHKTKDRSTNHSLVSIRVEPEIYGIIERYKAPENSNMLFCFKNMTPDYDSTYRMCRRVKLLCERYEFDNITPYWFRHTWATIARNECDVSKDDIDLCLAHAGNNPMADVYIRPDWSRVDRANRKVLDIVFRDRIEDAVISEA